MSKYYGVGGKRKGSAGNETYALTSAGNVVKAKVLKNNSRTAEQVIQRSKMQNCVKAFKQIGPDFFKGCFPNKKKDNSIYNAFVKANAKNGSPLHKKYSDDPFILGIGHKVIADGSLNRIALQKYYYNDDVQIFGLELKDNVPTDGSATVQQISLALKANYGKLIQEGDYLNFGGLFNNGVQFNNDNNDPLIVAGQHSIDKRIVNCKGSGTDTTPVLEKGFVVVEASTDAEGEETVHVLTMASYNMEDEPVHPSFFYNKDENDISYCFCVIARLEGSKILTTKSYVQPSQGYESLLAKIEANPFQQNGWITTLVKIAIITSYLANKVKEIINDWPI